MSTSTKVYLVVTQDGKQIDYQLEVMLEQLPRFGDQICILKPGLERKPGGPFPSDVFSVRRVWWQLDEPKDGETSLGRISVEVEPIVGAEHLLW